MWTKEKLLRKQEGKPATPRKERKSGGDREREERDVSMSFRSSFSREKQFWPGNSFGTLVIPRTSTF